MTKKTIGYVHLEWTCPNCGTRNLGTDKKCATCGSAQPEGVQFEQQVQEELVEDEAVVQAAEAGPDIHCPYCGTRNPASAERCRQCGGELAGGEARESGRVIGAFRPDAAPPVACPSCGTENPATALQCANCGARLAKPEPKPEPKPTPARSPRLPGWLIPAVVIAIIACLGLMALLTTRTSETVARVDQVRWERTILIEALAPITRGAWEESLPADAEVVGCEERLRYTSENPEPGSVEVCGTPYVVDTGTGVGEVVQDCEYQVFAPYCEYRTLAWVAVPAIVASGVDFSPQWPTANLEPDQRESGRQETYTVVFEGDGRSYTYRVRDLESYQRFTPGSRWRLDVNALGNVVGVEPAP